jgi:hypothetical protein
MNKQAKQIKAWYERFLLNKIALPIIRREERDSNYVKHYLMEREFCYQGHPVDKMDAYMDRQVCDLLCLLSTQGDSGFSIGFKRYLFDRGSSFKILSPLTFSDDEFGDWDSMDGKSVQNKRLSAVFKDRDGRIYDIDAFSYRISYVLNIDTHKVEKGNNLTWSGSVWLWDDIDNNGWEYFSRGYIAPDKKNFMGENRVVVPTIEIIDNTCGRGTFIMNISKKSAVPKEFFKDYYILSDRKDCDEDLAFLENHHAEFVEAMTLF